MKEKLRNPIDCHRLWTIQFAATMAIIGEEDCRKQTDLYLFVTENENWAKTREERKKWIQHVKSLKKANKEKPKVAEGMH